MNKDKPNATESMFIKLKHDVDFYRTLPLRQKIFLSSRMAFKLILGFIFLLLILSIFIYWKNIKTSRQLARLQQQKQLITNQIDSLKKRYPQLFDANQADKLLDNLTKQVKAKEKITTVLKKQKEFSRRGFSPFLQIFAKDIEPGVWLTTISIEQQGRFIILKGHAFKTESILSFVKKLNDSSFFEGKQFRLFQLEKKKEYLLDFELRTQEGKANE